VVGVIASSSAAMNFLGFEHRLADDLRACREAPEGLRGVVARDRGAHAARLAALVRADRRHRAVERGLIGRHELERARQARQGDTRISGAAEIVMGAAVLVDPCLHEFEAERQPANGFFGRCSLGHVTSSSDVV